tara:strand:- start:33 stop:479 length:447 start_codon:yes stop_codon:yes gene_type:complete
MKIYNIIDKNGLRYVGKTKSTLGKRLSGHKSDAKRDRFCSSDQLDLDNCIILLIEECSKEKSNEREHFWINKLKCVNKYKGNFNEKEWYKGEKRRQYTKQYRIDNREKRKQYHTEYYVKNRETIKQYGIDNKEKIANYQREWYIKSKH